MFVVTCRCSLSRVGVRCHVYVFVVACRCSNDDRTAPSTFTATGPATRKDSATCLVNYGLVGERLILNPFNLLVQKEKKNPMISLISLMLHNGKH